MDFLGGPEVLIILVVVLIVFGPNKLPKLARSIGEAAHEFRRGDSADHRDEATKAIDATQRRPQLPGDSFN